MPFILARHLSKREKLLEGAALFLLVMVGVLAVVAYWRLPATASIPVHFNADNQADGFGGRAYLFVEPAIAGFLYLVLLVPAFILSRLERHPEWNIEGPGVSVKRGKAQLTGAVALLRIVKPVLMLSSVFSLLQMAEPAFETGINWGTILSVAEWGMAGILALYLIRQFFGRTAKSVSS